VATYSFYPTKNLGALGDGGAVVSDREDVLARARALRQYGWESRYHATVPGGRNSRLDEIQAAFLRLLLPDVVGRNARRGAIRARYAEAVGDRLQLVPERPDTVPATHLCVARAPDRAGLVAALAAAGIGTAVHFPVPDHVQPAVAARRFRAGPLDHTLRACDEVVSLPCFPELTDAEIDRVVDAVAAS
jgi:dTDP-4-amino-4,6-dideoxygalactose transaminase